MGEHRLIYSKCNYFCSVMFRDQWLVVVDHAEFPTHVRVERLKTEVLGLPPESFLLHLSQSQTGHPTAMILAAYTGSVDVL